MKHDPDVLDILTRITQLITPHIHPQQAQELLARLHKLRNPQALILNQPVTQRQEQILKAMPNYNWYTPKQISIMLGMTDVSTVYSALYQLQAKGQLEATKQGPLTFYRKKKHEQATPPVSV